MKRFMVDVWRELAAKEMANGHVPSQVGRGAVPYPGTIGEEKENKVPAPGANLANNENENEIKKKKNVLKKIKEVISKNKVPRARKVFAKFFVFVFLSYCLCFYFSYFSYFFSVSLTYFILIYFLFYFYFILFLIIFYTMINIILILFLFLIWRAIHCLR